MKKQNKIQSLLEVASIIFVLLFTSVGCEPRPGKLAESARPIESAEQTQSLNKAALASSEAEELEVIVERNVPVPMRDGVILRADVYRPDRGGPYPVLVLRTAYGKDDRKDFKRFVKAGYIFVSQDVRGRHESEGKWESMYRLETHDAEDGYDTVEWAARLAGSNGRVGTVGNSYDGFLQWRLAPLRPPSLLAMSANGIDARHHVQQNGFISCGILYWWVTMSVNMRCRENRPGVNTPWEVDRLLKNGEREKWLNFYPRLQLPRELFEDEEKAFKRLLKYPSIDFWKLDEGCKDVSVPNFEIAGWYDPGKGDMSLYRAIVKEGRTEIARRGSRIIMGPWLHGWDSGRYGDFDFGPNADIDRIAAQVRWFDYWLKGEQNGVDKDAPVRIFVMGDNTWRDEQFWPLKHAKERILFLTSEGHANAPKGNGRLVEKLPQSSGIDRYEYNPRDPVPGYGFTPLNRSETYLIIREDILVYQTELLAERIEVTGNPVVELYAASSAPDTDWYVWFSDVSPDGLAREVSVGKVRARYRDGLDKPKLLKPGEVIKYTIRMSPISNAFLPGHRIRLDVSSSDFPRYDINHNTAADQHAEAISVVANQTIYHGGEWATRIILPWVPNVAEDEEPTEKGKVDLVSERQNYPLHQAAEKGDIEQVKTFISKGIDINLQDGEGETSLYHAVKAGKIEMVQLFIEAGADVNAGWKGALHVAIQERRKDIVELLIQNGADVNAKDKEGKTPLYYSNQNHNLDMIKLLVARGADIQSVIPEGLTLLHYMSTYDSPDIIEQLLTEDAKVDERDEVYEFTALHYAARFGTTKVAEVLIAKGADIEAKDKWGYQPIHWAAYHDRADIVELLIAKGADVNTKTSLGQMPLQLSYYLSINISLAF